MASASYPVPPNEPERLEALRRLRRLDGGRSQSLDRITRLAAFICKTPMSAVTLIGADTQTIKAATGMECGETPRSEAFCAHTILSDAMTIVEDTHQDARFSAHPLVTGGPHIRFYAGAPLVSEDFYNLGSLCVVDSVPRKLSGEQKEALATLSALVMTEFNLREAASDLADSLREVKALRDFLPTCSYCGEIRNDRGEWSSLQDYISTETTSRFSHGICPRCAKVHFPGIDVQGGRST